MSIAFDGLVDGLRLKTGAAGNFIALGWSYALVSFWLQREVDAAGIDEQLTYFEQNTGSNARMGVRILDSSNKISATGRAPDASAAQNGLSSGAIPIDATSDAPNTHIACLFNVDGSEIVVYVNGIPLLTGVAFGSNFDGSVVGDDNDIACRTTGGVGSLFLGGKISDYRIYAGYFTPEEIKCLYNMRGHDGLRFGRFDLAGRYMMNYRPRTTAVAASEVVDLSILQNLGTVASVLGAPKYSGDFLAYRRVVC